MQKHRPVRIAVAAAVACSFGVAIMLPGIAGAAVKPPQRATCTAIFGTESQQLTSGCAGSTTPSKFKGSAYGVDIPNSSDDGATIYWASPSKAYTTISFTDVAVAPTGSECGTELGTAATLFVTETATVTGGTSGLTVGDTPPSSNVCVYINGDGTDVVSGGASTI
jgi:hypothetical protein